jgi:hypothetical protein
VEVKKNMFTKRCPIPGCNFRYATDGGRGYHKHIAAPGNHPGWARLTESPSQAFDRFVAEFPEFFAEPRKPATIPPRPASNPKSMREIIAESAVASALQGPQSPQKPGSGEHTISRESLLARLGEVLAQCADLQCDIAAMSPGDVKRNTG